MTETTTYRPEPCRTTKREIRHSLRKIRLLASRLDRELVADDLRAATETITELDAHASRALVLVAARRAGETETFATGPEARS